MTEGDDEKRDQLRKSVEGKHIRLETCTEIEYKISALFRENNLSPAEINIVLDLLYKISLMQQISDMFDLNPRKRE